MKIEAITARGMTGTLAFDESLQQRLQLFRATKDDVLALTVYLETRITSSLLEQRQWLTANKERIYVVSGGFEEYIRPIVTSLGLLSDHVYANRFTYHDSYHVTGYDTAQLVSRAGGKAAQVKALGLPRPIVAIGDGYTDYEIKATDEADEFWAFSEHAQRPEIIEKANRVFNNFSELLLLDSHALD